jgi:hypothetical protein
MAIRGSCLCGGVRFEIDRAVGPVEYCHCNRCRKVSGSSAMLSIGVRCSDYRFLSGHELLRSYTAPILNAPPAYHILFCTHCGCCVPPPHPAGDMLEIPAGLFDDDPGIKPDKHIFVELLPAWDHITDNLPRYTLRELHKLRTGDELPPDFVPRLHRS